MNDRMAMFLFEIAQKGAKTRYRDLPTDFAIFNPYNQFPRATRKPAFMDRPHAPGYKTYPELSRPGLPIIAGAFLSHPVGAVIAFGIAVPLASHALAHKYPDMRAEMPSYMDEAYINAKIEQY